jgi:hypothetical protein
MGGEHPCAGQVKPRLAGPPDAPIVQLWPLPSHPKPGQKRTPAIPLSGMSYSTKAPVPESIRKFGAFRLPPAPPASRCWIHIGCAQPLMILRRLCVQVGQPGAAVGVGPPVVGVAVARARAVAVAVARERGLGVARPETVTVNV